MPDLRTGVYPGTFDPITIGHLDIVKRALRVVDKLIIAVAINADKGPLFPVEERVAMVQEDVRPLTDAGAIIEVTSFSSLLVDYAESVDASLIIRGLRAVSDFEYEFQMVGMNSRLRPEIETVFLMASDRHQFISSRFVKEIRRLGGDISQFVTPAVAKRLDKTFP
jgi:pantetheine-phosphate adenylyltransferase